MSFRPSGEVLHAILEQAVTTLTNLDVPVPARQYVAGGASAQDVPWDCAQLSTVPVQIRRGNVGDAGPARAQQTGQRGGGGLVRVLDAEIQLVRKYPTIASATNGRGAPKLPTADELGTAGDDLARDLDAIAAALDACVVDAAMGPANMVTVAPVRAVGPEGGFIAVVGGLSVSLMRVP